jgi:tetratricopeptide (TPR) repeat protein
LAPSDFRDWTFRFGTLDKRICGVVIALVLAPAAGPAQAAALCKLETTPPFFTDPQAADPFPVIEVGAGLYAAQHGLWDADIAVQKQVFESGGGSPNVYFMAAMNLSDAYWHEGKYAAAIAATNTALTTHVDDPVAYAQRAVMYFNNLNYSRAISDATQAITADPCEKRAYEIRALAYRREHMVQQAETDEAYVIGIDSGYIEQDPNNPALYVIRGQDRENQGAHDLAIADFGRAIGIDPNNDAAYMDRGLAYEAEGRYVDNVSDQTKAITRSPKDARAWNNLCWGLAVTGDLQDAMSSCDQAVTLAPRKLNAWNSLGFVDLKTKNYKQAMADYGVVLSINPESGSSLYGRGLAERNLGDSHDSAADIAKAERNDPDIASTFGT